MWLFTGSAMGKLRFPWTPKFSDSATILEEVLLFCTDKLALKPYDRGFEKMSRMGPHVLATMATHSSQI